MKTLVCVIGKNENKYILEWVEYYKKLGFTNICLFDNNDIDGEHFEDVLKEHIDNGFVKLVDYRGKSVCQLQAYTECYNTYGNEYEWIAFFDCDEFLTLVRNNTIEQYLKRNIFKKANMIHINWMNYTDNNNIKYEDKPLLERFTEHAPYDYKCEYNIPENFHIKTIIRGGLGKINWVGNPHTPGLVNVECTDSSGRVTKSESPFAPYIYTDAYLKHFTTKSAEEYASKMLRGFPDQSYEAHKARWKMLVETRFFKTNTVTKEKIEVFEDMLGVDMRYLLPNNGEKIKIEPGDVKIYSLCYAKKDFEFLHDSVITPLQVGASNGTDVCELKDNIGDNISPANFIFIENTGIYWIWRNVHDCKYKGNMQYRRPLSGITENTNFEEIFNNYEVITCKPYNYPTDGKPTKENGYMQIPANTVEGGYNFSNCAYDLNIIENIIKKKFPEYTEAYDKYIKNGEDLYYSSGFVLKSEAYDDYCYFAFAVMNDFLKETDIHTQLDLYYHVGVSAGLGFYKQKMGNDPYHFPKTGVKWQSEIGGFLMERLWTLWLLKNYPRNKIYEVPYIKMEEGMYT